MSVADMENEFVEVPLNNDVYDGPYPDASPYDGPEDDYQYPIDIDGTFYERQAKRLAELASFTEEDHERAKQELLRRMCEWKQTKDLNHNLLDSKKEK